MPLPSISIERQKALNIALKVLKVFLVVLLLYFFICSLSWLSDSFKLLAGMSTGM